MFIFFTERASWTAHDVSDETPKSAPTGAAIRLIRQIFLTSSIAASLRATNYKSTRRLGFFCGRNADVSVLYLLTVTVSSDSHLAPTTLVDFSHPSFHLFRFCCLCRSDAEYWSKSIWEIPYELDLCIQFASSENAHHTLIRGRGVEKESIGWLGRDDRRRLQARRKYPTSWNAMHWSSSA